MSDFASLYKAEYKQGKSYVRCTSDDPSQAFPKYNADGADEIFVESLRSGDVLPKGFDLLIFEWIIDCLEGAAHKFSENIVSAESIEQLRDKHAAALPDDPVIDKIIEYWREKRGARERRILIPHLRYEDIGKLGADPYVCFRRRELKVPRKTRRSDAQITDRLKKLHLDLSSMQLMLQAAIKRDRYKREALTLEGELFEKYRLVDGWRRHHKSEWPPHLATFKTAAQSLLEPKKKRARVEGGDEDMPNAYKIAIPVAALKGSRFARPYYPHDVGKAIQRDLDALVGHFNGGSEDCRAVDDLITSFVDLTGQNYHPASWLDGRMISCRRGRGGRIIVDRPVRGSIQPHQRPLQDILDPEVIKFHSTILSAKDFTQLQTPVGNYNVHAVQTANQILRPMSFQAWIASTAPIISSMAGGKPRSPKKKPPKKDDETMNGTMGAQITVKVKSQPKETQRKGTGARFTPHGLAPESKEDDAK